MDSLKEEKGITSGGLFKALIFVIFFFLPMFLIILTLWFGSNGFVFYIISRGWHYLEDNINFHSFYKIIFLLKFVSYFLGFFLVLSLWYLILRTIYLFGSHKKVDLRYFKESRYKQIIEFNNPKKIILTYHLRNPRKTIEQILKTKLSEELENYIKEFYPEFEYKPRYKWGSFSHNLQQISNIIEKIENDPTILDKIPLGEESLRITIKNLDNGEKNTISTESSFKILWFEGLTWVHPKIYPEYYNGSRYELNIKYKGLRGYDLKLWIR